LAQAKVSKSGQREVVSVPVLANIAQKPVRSGANGCGDSGKLPESQGNGRIYPYKGLMSTINFIARYKGSENLLSGIPKSWAESACGSLN
jgi:hypothetical protein